MLAWGWSEPRVSEHGAREDRNVAGSHSLLGPSTNTGDASHMKPDQRVTSRDEWQFFHLIRIVMRRISTMSVECFGERWVRMIAAWLQRPCQDLTKQLVDPVLQRVESLDANVVTIVHLDRATIQCNCYFCCYCHARLPRQLPPVVTYLTRAS